MSPVGLYRVQNAKGEGPYNSEDRPHRFESTVFRTFLNRHRDADRHPAPHADGLGYPERREFCAFASLDSLGSWFSAQEIQALAHHGFHVCRIWVDEKHIRRGRAQVLYVSTKARTYA